MCSLEAFEKVGILSKKGISSSGQTPDSTYRRQNRSGQLRPRHCQLREQLLPRGPSLEGEGRCDENPQQTLFPSRVSHAPSLQEQIQKCLECLRKEREEIQEIQSRENQRIQVLRVGHPPASHSLLRDHLGTRIPQHMGFAVILSLHPDSDTNKL